MKNPIKEEAKDVKGILKKIKKRDLRGNTGQAIKNSTYQLTTLFTAKIGSLIFSIIIARLLMPELFGLYGLALSTILLTNIFSDLGISTTILTFLSKTIDKRKPKAKAYFIYLSKIKIILVILTSLLVLLLAKWFAYSYYQKPIFYALLVGAIYLPLVSLSSFLKNLFTSKNNFRIGFIGELIVQMSRLVILPLLILFLISKSTANDITLLWIFIGLSTTFLLAGIYYITYFFSHNPLKGVKKEELTEKEKQELWEFTIPLIAIVLSGAFFGYIDIVMLGHYITSNFIGFYQAAFNLITAATAILSFSSMALFPIFARMKGKRLEKNFRKTKNITLLISIAALVFTILIAKILISIVYGNAYTQSTIYLQYLALLLISFPLIALYQAYYTYQKQTKKLSILLITATILNIILNYIFINLGLSWAGMNGAVLGACTATIISRYGYLAGLITFKKS
jgi:O-antigen/teichoic acid export membrane protein